MSAPLNPRPEPRSFVVLDQTEDGRARIQCWFEGDSIWLTQALMAELFAITPQNITQHLRAIYDEGELDEAATCKPYLQVRQEGTRQVQREVQHYSLPAILAVGYRTSEADTTKLFQVIQNKLHHAVTGMTAPELIAARADASLPNMGLTSRKREAVQRADVTVAKNDLREGEIAELNRIVVMFLDYAEDQTQRKRAIHLTDWTRKLDEFLRFNERAALPDAGRVSREVADERAQAEYERFAQRRRELAEAQGEADMRKAFEALEALEDVARALPKRSERKPEEES
jgi:hypothetical protein